MLNTHGAGFLEKVYENALAYEVPKAGRWAVQRYGAKVHYKDILAGEYFVDLLINDMLLVELKIVKALDDAHRMRRTNYLKATGLQFRLLPNFDKPRLEIKRAARPKTAHCHTRRRMCQLIRRVPR